MAQLKDLIVNGASRFIGDIFGNKAQLTTLEAPKISGGTEYGPGTSGQVLKSNGSSLYWANDNNSDVNVTQTITSTTNSDYRVLFSGTADDTTRTEGARKDTDFKWNPSTNTLTAANVAGNASSATKVKITNSSSLPSSGSQIHYLTYVDFTTTSNQDLLDSARTYIYENTTATYLNVGSASTAGGLTLHKGNNYHGDLVTATLTANRTYTLPDATGTIALTSSSITGNANTATAANITTNTGGVAYYKDTSGTFGNIRVSPGAFYSTEQDEAPIFGTLPVGQGGTGNTSYTANRLIYSESASKLSSHANLIIGTQITYAGRTITPLLRVNGALYIDDRVEAKNYFLVNKDSAGASYYLLSNNTSYGRFYVDTIGEAGTYTPGENGAAATATNGTLGEVYLDIGNSISRTPSSATALGANNARGRIRIYGTGTGALTILSDTWSGQNLNVVSATNPTAGSTGQSLVIVGNPNKKSETSASSTGRLRLYGDENGYHDIYPTSTTSNYTHYIPNSTGWIATGGNGTSTGVGGADQIVYLSTAGVLTAGTSATNDNTVSTIVKRDASGNFSAGTITANLNGNATTATRANITTTTDALTYYTNATGTFGDSAITITTASKHIGGFINGGQKSGTALGTNATAEGGTTTASGNYSHAEGGTTTASGAEAHAEGGNTTASGADSHAEGYNTTASGSFSHAEGGNATASGICSHAEGYNTTASASEAHAEGADTTASGDYSHAEGYYTTAQRKSQHVFGEYNVLDTGGTDKTTRGNYIEIVGNGSNANTRSNARTLDWNGNETIAGNLTAKSLYLFGLNSTNSTRYITSTAANNIAFSISGKYSLVVTDTAIQCGNAVAGTINLGASTHRWNNIYANSVNIAQYIKISNSNDPYIVFHRANSANQTARVINYLGSDNLEILSMQSQVVALQTTSGKVAALYSDGNFANFHGHIIAGAGDSNQQHNITAHSSAGEIYLYSKGSDGSKGIYATHPNPNNLNPPPQNHVLRVEQNGTVHIGDTNSAVKVVGNIAVETSCVRNIYAGTSDLTDGVSDLTTGAIYLVY